VMGGNERSEWCGLPSLSFTPLFGGQCRVVLSLELGWAVVIER